MTTLSSLRSQRSSNRRSERRPQVIIFQMQQDWFALPILAVKKVIPISDIYGNLQNSGVSLTVYQGRELLVLDLESLIFGVAQYTPATLQLNPAPTAQSFQELEKPITSKFMIVARNTQGDLMGLPLKSSPSVRDVPESTFAPVPAGYSSRMNIQYVSTLIVQSENKPLLFLLNPDRLIQSLPQLPQSL